MNTSRAVSIILSLSIHSPTSDQASKAFVTMQYSLLLTLAPLALASNDLVSRNLLAIRQGGDAFQPGVGGLVQNCPNPCGASECIIPSRGDTCCVEGCKQSLASKTRKSDHKSIPLTPYSFYRWLSWRKLLSDKGLLLPQCKYHLVRE